MYYLYVGMQLDVQIQTVSNSTLTNDKSADGVGDQSSEAASECSPIVMTTDITEGVGEVS